MNLNGKSFLTLLDFTPDEITGLLDLAAALKAKKKAGVPHDTLRGKNIALIFEKTSTRTRCSFEVAAHDLGRLYDGIEYRGFGQSIVEELAKYAGVPVWNGLTNEFHPTQILADMLTIREHFGSLKGRKLVFLGDCRYNMANSLMIGCAKLGMHFVASGPEGYFPDPALIARCEAIAAETGATLAFETDPAKAVAGADVLYTDVWVSMGEPMEAWAERLEKMLPYQVNQKLMDAAGEKALFMHCLPAFHDLNTGIGRQIGEQFHLEALEVTDEVFEGPRSIVFDEAENRMHTIKAVLAATLAN